MQADDFEKKIKNKMEEFGLVPDNTVWKEVSNKIEREKQKRRVLFYVLFTSFLLLTGSTAWWFISNENTAKFARKDTANINNNTAKIENYETKPNAKIVLKKLNKFNSTSIKNSPATITKKLAFPMNVEIKKTRRSEIKNKDFTKAIYQKVITKNIIANRKNDSKNVHFRRNQIPDSLPPHRFYNPGLATKKKADTSINNNRGENADSKKNTAANATAGKTIQTRIRKKWNWGFTVYGGFSNNRSGVPLLQNILTSNYDASPSALYNSNGQAYTEITATNRFKRAFSFGFGVFAKKKINKKISLSAGLDYHSYTAKLSVGNKVSQQRSFYDSSLEKALNVTEYFPAGSSESYLNKYRFLQLPVNLEYQINKNPKKPLAISAGVSPGFLISSNALHANPSANVYYVDKQQFNRLQLSAQIGFSIPLISSSKYLFSAGPQVQYSFTNASKASADARQHLFFTGIKANIILK